MQTFKFVAYSLKIFASRKTTIKANFFSALPKTTFFRMNVRLWESHINNNYIILL